LQISLDGSNDHAVAQIDVDGEWTRYGTLVPAAQANGSTTLYITQTGAVTETFYIDLIQVEQTAYHTSAAWGGAGPGYAWSGTEHASTSTRTASYIDLDDQVDLVSEVDQLTFRFVVRMPYSADDDWPDEALLFDVRGASDNHRIYIEYEDSDDRFHVYLNGVDRFQSSAQTFGAGDWLELVLALDFSGDAVLSIDGTQDGSADISALTAPTLTTWSLGADYNGANQANLAFGAYQVFNCVSSSAEILWMNGQDLRARWLWTSCRSAESAKLNGRRVRHVVKALLDVDGEPYPRSRDGDVAFLRVYGTSGQTTAMVDTDDQVHPTMRITPRDSKSSGFEHKMFQIVPWTPDEAITRYPVMLGPFNLTGKAQADGDDIRVYVNGEEVDRWLGGTLVSSVKVWVNLAFDAGQSATLATDIGSADSVAEIVASTDISGFPQAGALEINGELFIYTDKNSQAKRFLGVTRATRGTSAGSHTAGDTINWIQHDVVVFYGDSSLSAPTTDDDYKPAFDLDSSTNSSWVFEVFGEDDGLRVMDWEGEADNRHYTIDSETYTDNHHSDTDPWAELGCYVNPGGSYVNSWAQWTFFNPCGISSLSLTNGEFYIYQDLGYDYKQGRILSSPSGTSWTVEATYDLPDTFGSWTSASDLTAASITTGATYVRFQVRTDRTVGSTPDYTNLEYADATVGIANGPSVTSSAEIDNYSLDCTITNQTTGEAISVAAEMQVDQVLVIDTETRVVELEDGTRLASAVDPDSSRIGWLPLVDGENVILYEESGAVEVDVDLLWDRRLFE
jgi:hypothetical protein